MKIYSYIFVVMCVATLSACNDSGKKNTPVDTANLAPQAMSASFTTQTDTAYSGMLMGSDADGDALSYSIVSDPMQGSLMLNEADGSYTYTPNATVTGEDAFSFSVSDGTDSSAVASITVTIAPLQLSFSAYSRAAFNQQLTDEPLPLNGREFSNDVSDEAAYDDLLQ